MIYQVLNIETTILQSALKKHTKIVEFLYLTNLEHVFVYQKQRFGWCFGAFLVD